MPLHFPPHRILVPVDFSEPSRKALQFGARFAVQCRAELHVLHAEDPLLAAAASAGGIDLRRETLDELSAFIQASALSDVVHSIHSVKTAAPVKTCGVHVAGGAARQVICDIATREQVDTIVIGARGMSGTEHFVFGSTTEGVLRLTSVPVVVVPHTWTPPDVSATDLTGTGPVIAAVDFCEPSVEAARAAARLARTLGTSIELVHVVPPLPVITRWTVHAESAVAEQVDCARRELAQLGERVSEGAGFEVRVDVGAVPQRLSDIARAHDGRHPILFLGRRRAEDRGAAPGAIAYRVLTLAQVPVVMHLHG